MDEKLREEIERRSPVNVTISFGSSLSKALRSLSVESHLRKGLAKQYPLSRRHPDVKRIEMDLEIIDMKHLDQSSCLNLTIGVALHWKDERLTKLQSTSSDTFGVEENIWYPELNLMDRKETYNGGVNVLMSRTLQNEWVAAYNLRARSIKDVLWEKLDSKCNQAETQANIKPGKYIFSSEESPMYLWQCDKDTWKRLGFVKNDLGAFDEEYTEVTKLPVPRRATLVHDHIAENGGGNIRIRGFLNEAQRYTRGDITRTLGGDATLFFPFDYIEDVIGLNIAPSTSTRDLVLNFRDHVKPWQRCIVCGRQHKWTLGGDGKRNDGCLTWKRYNGFQFRLLQTINNYGQFLGNLPCIKIEGWRCPAFYQSRIQVPILILNLLTNSIFFFSANDHLTKIAIIMTSYLVLASLLYASAAFILSSDGVMTIIDFQLIVNMMYMLGFTFYVLFEWFGCAQTTLYKIEAPPEDACNATDGPLVIFYTGPIMVITNVVLTFNPFGTGVYLRYLVYIFTCFLSTFWERHEGGGNGKGKSWLPSPDCPCFWCKWSHMRDLRKKVNKGKKYKQGERTIFT